MFAWRNILCVSDGLATISLLICLNVVPALAQKPTPEPEAASLCTRNNALYSTKLQASATRTLDNGPQRVNVLIRSADLLRALTTVALMEPCLQLPAQKSLNIERYGDEPLQLIGLKIGSQSIADKIAHDAHLNSAGIDTITFKEHDGWFRNLEFRLRNISGKPIYGVRSHLFFRPSETKTVYSLPLAAFTQSGQGVLEPGGEITLTVTEQAWTLTAEILKYYDVDPDKTVVSFGVDAVQFSDNEQWTKGRMLRHTPTSP